MNKSNNFQKYLLRILSSGILNVRILSEQGDSKNIFFEADHIHNLPSLLESRSSKMLSYYLDVEVPIYRKKGIFKDSAEFLECWKELKMILDEGEDEIIGAE